MVLNVLSLVKVILTQSSARSRKSASLSIKDVSPLTEAIILGIWARSCASVVISFAIVVCIGEFYLLGVCMFVKHGELDKRYFGVYALPTVEAYDYTMNGEKQVVIRLLEGLGYGVKLALVRAAVVRLRLARH